jgi:hypothetical protein
VLNGCEPAAVEPPHTWRLIMPGGPADFVSMLVLYAFPGRRVGCGYAPTDRQPSVRQAVGSRSRDKSNKGAQSALLAARAREAASTGCRWLVAETAKPAKGAVNPSLNNMLGSGLRPQYDRPNWIWRPDGKSRYTDQST